MKNIKYFIICLFLTGSTLSACGKDTDVLTETAGALSVQALLGSFSSIDFLSDLYLYEVYEYEGVSDQLYRVEEMNNMVKEQLNVLLNSRVLDEEDAYVVGEMTKIYSLLNQEINSLFKFMRTDTEKDYNNFLDKRSIVEQRLIALMDE